MSLSVSRMVSEGDMDNTEYILYGVCVDNCNGGAIQYAWGRGRGLVLV
jgi:hypothetical protein